MATLDGRQDIVRCTLGALIMLWAGVLIGVSFLAAPAKFGALNLVEIALAVASLALEAYVRPERAIWLGLGLAALIVALQWLWLLPTLDARAELIIQGGTPEPAPWHALYIGAEIVKLLALLTVGWIALWRPRSG